MILSRGRRICLAISLAYWGLIWLPPLESSAQAPEAAKPAVANAPGDSHVAEGDEEQKSAAELASLKDKVKTLSQAFEANKKELAPRLREAQSRVQQLTAARQKASGSDTAKSLEEDLRLAQESLALLEQARLAEEQAKTPGQVHLAELMQLVAEKRGELA